MKLKPKKYSLFKREVVFLGRVACAEGYKLHPSAITPVLRLKETSPKTIRDVRKLMGFLNYYRGYIPNFSTIAKPIYDILKLENNSEKLMGKGRRTAEPFPGQPVTWTTNHQLALEKLIEHLVNLPLMAYLEPNSSFILHTDASESGLGAVLYQQQNGKLRVIAYASRSLSPTEKNYHFHSGKLEFLAMKWAICEHFRDYLCYAPSFVVCTDNNPLTCVLSTANLDATGHPLVGELAEFNFTIRYRPGKSNVDADTLSRTTDDTIQYMESCSQETNQEELKTIIDTVQLQEQGRVH